MAQSKSQVKDSCCFLFFVFNQKDFNILGYMEVYSWKFKKQFRILPKMYFSTQRSNFNMRGKTSENIQLKILLFLHVHSKWLPVPIRDFSSLISLCVSHALKLVLNISRELTFLFNPSIYKHPLMHSQVYFLKGWGSFFRSILASKIM